jgi:hypothetical protein
MFTLQKSKFLRKICRTLQATPIDEPGAGRVVFRAFPIPPLVFWKKE